MSKKLGVIGGAGPYASALFYRRLLDEMYKKGSDRGEIVILNYPFTQIHGCASKEEFDQKVEGELQSCVDRLLQFGIDRAVIICNTFHSYLDKLKGGIDFAHMPNTVIEALCQSSKERVLILCTEVTASNRLYEHPSYVSIYPNREEQKWVNLAIQHVLEGSLQKEDTQLLEQIVRRVSHEESIDAVVLGCTELPVLHAAHPLKVLCPLFDSIGITAQRLGVKWQ